MMTEERRRAWENAWETQRNKLEQNLQISQFYFDLRAVSTCPASKDSIRVSVLLARNWQLIIFRKQESSHHLTILKLAGINY